MWWVGGCCVCVCVCYVLWSLDGQELEPALQWVRRHSEEPTMNPTQRARVMELLFQLHKLALTDMLDRGSGLLLC